MIGQFIVASALLLSSAHAFYSGTAVVELTASNWNQVFDDTSIWMLEFYAPWCGHCKNLAPQYLKAAENVEGMVKVGAVDCDAEENKQICGQFGIRGFPTLKLLPWDATKARASSQAMDYNGARSAASIAKFMLNSLPNHVSSLKDDKKVAKFLGSSLKKVILFSDKKKVSNMYKALSMQYKNRLIFGQTTTDSSLAEQFGVEKSPTLMVVDGDAEATAENASIYEGKLKVKALNKWLKKQAPAGKKSGGNDASAESEEEEVKVPKTPAQEELWRLTSTQDYTDRCVDRAGTCVIGLLDPLGDGFAQYRQTLDDVVEKQSGGAFTIVWLDGFEQEAFMKQLGLYGQDLPILIVVNDGKRAWSQYIGAFDAEHINSYLGKLKTGTISIQKLREGIDVGKPIKTEKKQKDEL